MEVGAVGVAGESAPLNVVVVSEFELGAVTAHHLRALEDLTVKDVLLTTKCAIQFLVLTVSVCQAGHLGYLLVMELKNDLDLHAELLVQILT